MPAASAGGIGAAVVDEHQLERHIGDGLKGRVYRLQETLQRLCFVVARHDDGNRAIRVGGQRGTGRN